MKNLKKFHEFAVNEALNEYSSLEFGSLPKERSTKLGRRLEDIRSRIRKEIDYEFGYGEKTGFQMNQLDSPKWLLKNIFAGLVGAASGAAELFSPKGKKGLIKNLESGEVTPEEAVEMWGKNLGPTTTEKDLEDFAKKSEKIAIKRYGKEWDYNNPRGQDQKKFRDLIRKGEEEIVDRLKEE